MHNGQQNFDMLLKYILSEQIFFVNEIPKELARRKKLGCYLAKDFFCIFRLPVIDKLGI